MTTPILLLGAGRMGGALAQGWARAGAFQPHEIMFCDPHAGDEAQRLVQAGARLNPPPHALAEAQTVVLAVKPQAWRAAASAYAPGLAADALVVSIAAGVQSADIAEAFGRPVGRVMPTTGVALAAGVASIYARDRAARQRAHALFDPVATVVDLYDEALLDGATAVSGSGPAYLYAFVEALEAAARAVGLPQGPAEVLARATVISAAALMADSTAPPAELRRQVTSPAGTTEAALRVLMGEGGLTPLLREAVQAAAARARELAAG